MQESNADIQRQLQAAKKVSSWLNYHISVSMIHLKKYYNLARGNKTFFMFNSAEQEIYPAHKC